MHESAAWLASPLGTVAAALFGAIWGSFCNVVIARVPAGQSIVRPGSRCAACFAPVRAMDNVPILSYFWLRGKCRACAAPFSARYPLVEALMAALGAGLWWAVVARDAGVAVEGAAALAVPLARFALYFAFAGVLVVLAFIDLATLLLPDAITRPAIAGFFLAGAGAHDTTWAERAIGGAAGYLFVRLIADFYYYVLKREGLGLGDGKLLALIGVVLGWRALPTVVFAGSVLGSLISIPVLVARRRSGAGGESLRHVQVPFGPFLVLGALIQLFASRLLGRDLLLVVAGWWT
jgi:leader peptidase (prepilin peptidase)/N-methyltransferase